MKLYEITKLFAECEVYVTDNLGEYVGMLNCGGSLVLSDGNNTKLEKAKAEEVNYITALDRTSIEVSVNL